MSIEICAAILILRTTIWSFTESKSIKKLRSLALTWQLWRKKIGMVAFECFIWWPYLENWSVWHVTGTGLFNLAFVQGHINTIITCVGTSCQSRINGQRPRGSWTNLGSLHIFLLLKCKLSYFNFNMMALLGSVFFQHIYNFKFSGHAKRISSVPDGISLVSS